MGLIYPCSLTVVVSYILVHRMFTKPHNGISSENLTSASGLGWPSRMSIPPRNSVLHSADSSLWFVACEDNARDVAVSSAPFTTHKARPAFPHLQSINRAHKSWSSRSGLISKTSKSLVSPPRKWSFWRYRRRRAGIGTRAKVLYALPHRSDTI